MREPVGNDNGDEQWWRELLSPETLAKLKALKVEPPEDDEIPGGLELDDAIRTALQACGSLPRAAGALNRAGYTTKTGRQFTETILDRKKKRLGL